MPSRVTERINFGKIKEIVVPPNMIELQTNSYKEFLQADAAPKKRRKHIGLEAVFLEVFPIESYDGKIVLDYKEYEIGEPKVDWLECLREGTTYGAPLYVTFKLREEGKGAKEEKVFMGELPLMTPQGTFVINGAERVVVSQLHRSPGIAFEATQHPNGKMLHSFRGTAEGIILDAPRGHNGFGYDPLFYFPQIGKTFAELSAEEKAQYSHRGAAFRAFLDWHRET